MGGDPWVLQRGGKTLHFALSPLFCMFEHTFISFILPPPSLYSLEIDFKFIF